MPPTQIPIQIVRKSAHFQNCDCKLLRKQGIYEDCYNLIKAGGKFYIAILLTAPVLAAAEFLQPRIVAYNGEILKDQDP